MNTVQLGTISKVGLRDIWAREDVDFTPWLEENLSLLGASLGMELEIRQREAPVGGFSLDLLAHDLGSDRKVVIENQFHTTDHDHLGKLLTYAGGYDVDVVVWLSEDIGDEHRQALDWLNQRTGEETEFFGVVVELIRVDSSRPAVNFRLVAFPNEWRKARVSGNRSGVGAASDRGLAYQSFFQTLVDELRTNHNFTRATKAQAKSWCPFSSGLSGIKYHAAFNKDDNAHVDLSIDQGETNRNKAIFDALLHDAKKIESEFGSTLDWRRLDGKQVSRIVTTRPATIGDDEDALVKVRGWMVAQLLKFREVFPPRLTAILD